MSLASIQKVEEVNEIPNADFIEVVKVLNWRVVTKKGEFKPGDLCVYVEIDSLIPNREWSKFLFKDFSRGVYVPQVFSANHRQDKRPSCVCRDKVLPCAQFSWLTIFEPIAFVALNN